MKIIIMLVAIMGALVAASTSMAADDAFFEALSSGKVSFSARARYEMVDQDNVLKDAAAFTLRSTLAYRTGFFYGFSAFGEIEDITEPGSDNYNSSTNGKPAYSVIADPNGTEVNQAYLQYNGFDTRFRLGRQEIGYRKAPIHRFIGNVLWRQNHQSFDAFSLINTAFENTVINYAYINRVHTIFGDDRNVGTFIKEGDINLDAHLINVQYTGLSIGKLEAYGYFLDYGDEPAVSSKTSGLRFNGNQAVNSDWKVIYTAEIANQDHYKEGRMDDHGYYLAELGGKYKGWLAKISYELQEGDGTDSFTTPLGTNHAFQGWADQFLTTPANGLEDRYLTIAGQVLGVKVVLVYHDFKTDKGSDDAGEEFDILIEKTFKKHYTLGGKYSDYDAGKASVGKVDTQKLWLYAQVKF